MSDIIRTKFQKKKLLISFSGGKTSAFMLKWILENWKDKYEYKIVFANTGKEHEGTLEFVRDCSYNFNCEIIWIEGVPFTKKGWGVTFKEVTFETASRKGEPFEEMLRFLGIPSSEAPFCSDQLKRLPIEAYLKSIGWKTYYRAIGIRSDEIDRCNPNYIKKKIIYPLISNKPITKNQVNRFWENYFFTLHIPNNMGNCDNCWKKSFKILLSNMEQYPESFLWWEQMVNKYGNVTSSKKDINITDVSFFRGGVSVEKLRKMSKEASKQINLFDLLYKNNCSESCEVF